MKVDINNTKSVEIGDVLILDNNKKYMVIYDGLFGTYPYRILNLETCKIESSYTYDEIQYAKSIATKDLNKYTIVDIIKEDTLIITNSK